MRRATLALIFAACGADPAVAPDAAAPPDASIDASLVDARLDAADVDARLDAAAVDAALDAGQVDAALPTWEVPCVGAPLTISTAKSDFTPEHVTVPLGSVVRFAPLNPHDVVAGTFAAPEPWFQIDGNTTGCVRFDTAGTFAFFCSAHPFSMTGAITVE